MGGMQTLRISLARPEPFALVGTFSAQFKGCGLAQAYGGAFRDTGASTAGRGCCGWQYSAEPRLAAVLRGFRDAFDKAGVRDAAFEPPGTAHE